MSQIEPIWTAPRVQSMAQAAVTIELYTLPFYLTALTSMQDTDSQDYFTILSVAMEEMLHMEMAANLCLALGTTPNFTAPIYGNPIPFLDPDDPATGNDALINAELGPLDQTRLDTMLDIETPEEFEQGSNDLPADVYSSIGAFYDALSQGIQSVGWDKFSGSIANQQAIFGATNFPEKIASLVDAQTAIATITEQGEGKRMSPVPQPPFVMVQFPIPPEYRMADPSDPAEQNSYSHFGRFVNIQAGANSPGIHLGVYDGVDPNGPLNPEQQGSLNALQQDFATLLSNLNGLWATGQGDWRGPMLDIMTDAVSCWQAGVTPMWSPAQASVTPQRRRKLAK